MTRLLSSAIWRPRRPGKARRPVRAGLYPLALLLAMASTASAAPPIEGRGDTGRGAFLVQRWCTSCHAAAGRGTDAVPGLAEVARRNDDGFLRVFLAKPHGGMPDPGLETQAIEDVIAYLRALK